MQDLSEAQAEAEAAVKENMQLKHLLLDAEQARRPPLHEHKIPMLAGAQTCLSGLCIDDLMPVPVQRPPHVLPSCFAVRKRLQCFMRALLICAHC